jgi:hypothetical protein
MKETECSETLAYKIQTPGELPRRKHTTGSFMLANMFLWTFFENDIIKFVPASLSC